MKLYQARIEEGLRKQVFTFRIRIKLNRVRFFKSDNISFTYSLTSKMLCSVIWFLLLFVLLCCCVTSKSSIQNCSQQEEKHSEHAPVLCWPKCCKRDDVYSVKAKNCDSLSKFEPRWVDYHERNNNFFINNPQ